MNRYIQSIRASSTVFYMKAGGSISSNAQTIGKIQSFGRLPHGWHYGKGAPASQAMIRAALTALSTFMALGFPLTDAFPGIGGEIMVTAYKGRHCIELTIEPNNTFTIAHEFAGEDRFYESERSNEQIQIDLAEIARNIEQLEQEKCATSYSSILNATTIAIEAGLQIWPLSHPAAITPERRLSICNAEPIQPAQFANTSISSTQGWGDLQPLFGSSMPSKFPIPAT
jgi:hypothetical protein